MALLTVTQAKTAFDNFKRDTSDVSTGLFIDWSNFINNEYYRTVRGIDPEQYMSSSTINVVDDTESYSLPSDFESIQEIGTGLFRLDDNDNPIDTQMLPLTGYGSQKYGYFLDSSNIVITPVPTSSYNLIFRYIPLITQLTDLSDSMLIDDRYLQYIVKAFDVLYEQWDENKNSEVFADQRFQRVLDQMCTNIKRAPMIASLPNVSNY